MPRTCLPLTITSSDANAARQWYQIPQKDVAVLYHRVVTMVVTLVFSYDLPGRTAVRIFLKGSLR